MAKDYVVEDTKLIAIAEEIRNSAGVTDEYSLEEMPEGVRLVYNRGHEQGYDEGIITGEKIGYDKGKQAEYNLLWDTLQNNGSTSGANYYYKFSYSNNGVGWTDENFNPKYPLICANNTTSAMALFYANTNITDTKVPIVALGSNIQAMFYNASKLVTIRKIIVHAGVTVASTTFQGCTALENITVDGVIGQDFDIHWSTKLTKASIGSIMAALSTTNKGKSVSLSKAAVNKAFETSEGAKDGSTSEEWATLADTRPNWTISLADA